MPNRYSECPKSEPIRFRTDLNSSVVKSFGFRTKICVWNLNENDRSVWLHMSKIQTKPFPTRFGVVFWIWNRFCSVFGRICPQIRHQTGKSEPFQLNLRVPNDQNPNNSKSKLENIQILVVRILDVDCVNLLNHRAKIVAEMNQVCVKRGELAQKGAKIYNKKVDWQL